MGNQHGERRRQAVVRISGGPVGGFVWDGSDYSSAKCCLRFGRNPPVVEATNCGNWSDVSAFSCHYRGSLNRACRRQDRRCSRHALRAGFDLYCHLENSSMAARPRIHVTRVRSHLLLRARSAPSGLEMVNARLGYWRWTVAACLVRL